MNIAILWDIENVTPPTGSNFVEQIIEMITSDGKLSYAMAFGDWNKDNIKGIATDLAGNSFELIHIPKAKKNSADTSLVAHGLELIFKYPHLERFVVVSGDADFRPLLSFLRKYGKETWVICDVNKNASEDLLKMADRYFDYRTIIDEEDVEEKDSDSPSSRNLSRKQGFELFEEAVSLMIREKKRPNPGSVKIKMKLLNEMFDEKKLGYKNWNGFIKEAIEKTNVTFVEEGKDILVIEKTDTIPEVFKILLDSIPDGKGTVSFASVAQKMKENNIELKNFGYSRFKSLALDAEKRGYVELHNQGLRWSLRKK